MIAMAKIKRISTERIEREDNYLYYIGNDGYVWRTPMRTNKNGFKSKIGTEHIEVKNDGLYYVDDSGYVVCEKHKEKKIKKKSDLKDEPKDEEIFSNLEYIFKIDDKENK